MKPEKCKDCGVEYIGDGFQRGKAYVLDTELNRYCEIKVQ